MKVACVRVTGICSSMPGLQNEKEVRNNDYDKVICVSPFPAEHLFLSFSEFFCSFKVLQ